MIPIKMNKYNLDFRDCHYQEIEPKLRGKIIQKRDICLIKSFEYQALDWINKRFKDILIGNLLRNIIYEFNTFIKTFVFTVTLTITNDDKTITIEKLKQICRENNILGFSNKNKNELVTLVNSNTNLTGDTIDNLKCTILSNKINLILKNIFEDFYENQWDKIDTYDRYIFVTKHKLKTCPYCNMGYILISERDNKKKNGLRPEIDHFFPKSKYPYLAMSFYNLIPSCQVCNHTKKSKDTFKDELLSPYEIDESAFKFTYNIKNINLLEIQKYNFDIDSLDIDIEEKNKQQNNDYFKLDKLYKQHKDIVLELIIKKRKYPKSYIEELKRSFKFTDDEIYRLLLCNYKNDDDLNKRPLSKLIRDITDELDFF